MPIVKTNPASIKKRKEEKEKVAAMSQTEKQSYTKSEKERKAGISQAVSEKQHPPHGNVSPKDPIREELRQIQLERDGEFAKDVFEKGEEEKVRSMAQRSVDIEAKKEELEPTKAYGATGKEEISHTTREEIEINNIQYKLSQEPTGGVLDTINRWRLEVKLTNLVETQRKTEAGEMQSYGAIPIGILGGAAAGITRAGMGVGQLAEATRFTGIAGQAINAKTIALTGTWLRRLGFTAKAAVSLGGLIGLTAWGKHVKSEAIEFLPYQIQLAREAGDEATAQELEQLFYEIANPTGWANIMEEVPGLGVIKAAMDKTRVGMAIIEAQKRRAE